MSIVARVLIAAGLVVAVAHGGAALAAAPSLVPGMPREVMSLRDESLPRAAYDALAAEWRAYLADHPRSAVAEVQLGRALRYAGAPPDEVRACFERALALDPLCPEALDAAAATCLGEWEPLAEGAAGCYELGLQAVVRAPDWPDPHFTLYALALALGRLEEAEEHLAAMLRKGGIAAPLVDYCYNMLVGAQDGAIIFTNGDNDTFGTLALQVVHGIRPDVQVVNLSLISHPDIEAAVFARFAGSSPLTTEERRDLRRDFEKNVARDRETYFVKVVRAVAKKAAAGDLQRPLYLALTVSPERIDAAGQPRRLEGLLWRIVAEPQATAGGMDLGTDLPRTWRLFQDAFRLESATDLSFPWPRFKSIAALMQNYTAVLTRVAAAAGEEGDTEVMRDAFRHAAQLAAFHGREGTVATLVEYWRRLDPDNPELDAWRRRKD